MSTTVSTSGSPAGSLKALTIWFWSRLRALSNSVPSPGVDVDDRVGAQAEVAKVLGVAKRGPPAGRNDLGFESTRPHRIRGMIGDVAGDHLDAAIGFRNRFLVGIAPPDTGLQLVRLITEQSIEELVELFRPFDGEVQ